MNSIYRIKHLLYKDFKETKIALGIISAIFTVACIISIYADFNIFIFICGSLFPFILFLTDYLSEKQTTSSLLLPASNQEKIISRMITGFIFTPVYISLIYVISGLFVHCISKLTGGSLFIQDFLFDGFSLSIILLLFLIQIIVPVFYLRFGQKTLNRTLWIVFILIIFKSVFEVLFEEIFPFADALLEYEFMLHGAFFQNISCILNSTMIILTILLWITAYFCLQEKELE
jgi:hypothetical protein